MNLVRAVLPSAAVLALALLPSNVVATVLPLLRAEWGASATALGWVFAAYQAGYVAAVLVLLPLTDRVHAGRVVLGSAVATAAASLLFPYLATDVWSASVLRAVAGAGLAGVYLPGVRIVAAAAPAERRGLAVGLYVAAFYLGASLSYGATGLLLGDGDWRRAALVLGACAALGVPLALLAPGSKPSVVARRFLDPAVLGDPAMRRTIAAYSGHSWELYVSRAWLAAFLASVVAAQGITPNESASLGGQWAALIAGMGTLGVWLGGWLSDHWGRFPAALGLAAASGVISLVYGFLGGAGWPLLILVGCVYSVLIAADSAIYSTAVTELARPGQLGSAQAVQAFIGFSASTVSPVAAGAVLDLGGGFGGVFVVAGLASLAGALALLPMAQGAVRPR